MLLLRNSERHEFKRCPQRWHWRYNEHLNIPKTDGPLWFGTGIHLALEKWYIPGTTRGIEPVETWQQFAKDSYNTIRAQKLMDDVIESEMVDALILGTEMLEGYRKKYGKDDQWEVLLVEHPFEALIPSLDNPKVPVVKAVGKIDLVVRDLSDGLIKMLDHKTAAQITVNWLNLNDQNGGYLAVGTHALRKQGKIGEREAIRGLLYNFLRKAKQDDRPTNAAGEALNKDGTVSKKQPAENFVRHWVSKTTAERNAQVRHIADEFSVMQKFRSGELPLYKNPTRDCQWDCQFYELCGAHESGGDLEDMKRIVFKKEDPYVEYMSTRS